MSKLCAEPRASLAAITEMLAPQQSAGRIRVELRSRVVAMSGDGQLMHSATVRSLGDGGEKTISASMFLDATETGELLPLAGTDYVTGAESREECGEPHAPVVAAPQNMQGFTVCFAFSHHDGEDHTICRPAQYEFWRDYHPDFWPAPSNGCFRLHPVEWNIGEVAGVLAAFCLSEDATPQAIHRNELLRSSYLSQLDHFGIQRHWPEIRGY